MGPVIWVGNVEEGSGAGSIRVTMRMRMRMRMRIGELGMGIRMGKFN